MRTVLLVQNSNLDHGRVGMVGLYQPEWRQLVALGIEKRFLVVITDVDHDHVLGRRDGGIPAAGYSDRWLATTRQKRKGWLSMAADLDTRGGTRNGTLEVALGMHPEIRRLHSNGPAHHRVHRENHRPMVLKEDLDLVVLDRGCQTRREGRRALT